jgi:hypothetical protein
LANKEETTVRYWSEYCFCYCSAWTVLHHQMCLMQWNQVLMIDWVHSVVNECQGWTEKKSFNKTVKYFILLLLKSSSIHWRA